MSPLHDFIIFFIIAFGGLLLMLGIVRALPLGRIYKNKNKNSLNVAGYLLYFVPYVGALLFIIQRHGMIILEIYAIFAVIGTVSELLVAYFYYHIVGERFWIYPRFGIAGHTSFLAVPVWGFAGVYFWLIFRVFT